jgi:hypothetical protein
LGQFKDDVDFGRINFESEKQVVVFSKKNEVLGYLINQEKFIEIAKPKTIEEIYKKMSTDDKNAMLDILSKYQYFKDAVNAVKNRKDGSSLNLTIDSENQKIKVNLIEND